MVSQDKYSIEKLVKKDPMAFRAFHQEHVRLYCQFGLRFIDDMEAVRDIVQEAFIAMWNGNDFSGIGSRETFSLCHDS